MCVCVYFSPGVIFKENLVKGTNEEEEKEEEADTSWRERKGVREGGREGEREGGGRKR